MCSINGFNFTDKALILEMMQETKHRGPDQEGVFCGEDISLGHARLSIIDLTERGRQPIWNEDHSICVLCNGEIYNYKELKKELQEKGHRFTSDSDSEVIVHLYEEKKDGCPGHLNGIFAFAIYDKNEKKIFMARDRVGIKPLYYYFDGSTFIFSSEIKAILAHPVPKVIDHEALCHHFRLFFTPAPFTLFKNVFKLRAGHCLSFCRGKLRTEEYWDITDCSEITSKGEASEGLTALLKDSVKRQIIADRPFGVFLSGGIDSTAVLGLVCDLAGPGVKTYSVGFEIPPSAAGKFNRDLDYARETSRHFGTDHHELFVKDTDARDHIEKIIWHLEEPVPNPSQIPLFLLAREAKKDVAVVLGGNGGDELFGGYTRYYYSKLMDRYQRIPGIPGKGLLPYLLEQVSGKRNLKKKLNTPPGTDRYLLFLAQKKKTLSRFLQPPFTEDVTRPFLKRLYREDRFQDPLKFLMYLDFKTWLPDESIVRFDKTTMANALEHRVPILDHRLTEFAFRISTDYKVRGKKNSKWIFREAMKAYLPPHILNKDKRGWFSPGSSWLRGALKDFTYDVLSPDYCPATGEYFNFPEIKKILDDHISGAVYNMFTIWTLLTFQIWHKTFVSGRGKP